MSYSADARVVRDDTRTLAEREAALVRCVTRFCPFGLMGTFAHLDRFAGHFEPAERLVTAIGVLDAAHAAWREELAGFARQRKDAKVSGQRRVVSSDLTRYATYGWPGDATGVTAGRALDPQFLRSCGMAVWEPQPVNLRRRLRWTERALTPAPRFEGCLPLAMAVVLGVLALCTWGLFSPPRIFWYGYGGTAALAFGYAIIHGFREAAKQAPRHRSTRQALARRKADLADRLERAEARLRRAE